MNRKQEIEKDPKAANIYDYNLSNLVLLIMEVNAVLRSLYQRLLKM